MANLGFRSWLESDMENLFQGSPYIFEFYRLSKAPSPFYDDNMVQYSVMNSVDGEYCLTLSFVLKTTDSVYYELTGEGSEGTIFVLKNDNKDNPYWEDDIEDIFLTHKWRPTPEGHLIKRPPPNGGTTSLTSSLLKRSSDDERVRLVEAIVHNYAQIETPEEEARIEMAISYFPYQGGTLYRALTFSKEEAYREFLKKTRKGNVFQGGGKWFKDRDMAARMAIGDDAAPENWEQGFRGMMIGIIVDEPNSGIDLDLVLEAKESYSRDFAGRVWLKKDTYELATERRIPKGVVTRDTADESLYSLVNKQDSSIDDILFVIRNFDNISDGARSKSFRYLYSKPKLLVEYRPGSKWGAPNLEILTNVDAKYWSVCEYFDLWLPQDQDRILNDLRSEIRRVDRQTNKLIREEDLDLSKVRIQFSSAAWLFQLCGEGMTSLQSVLGRRYQSLGDEGRDINKIKDPREFKEAIEEHTRRLVTLMENLTKSIPEKRK